MYTPPSRHGAVNGIFIYREGHIMYKIITVPGMAQSTRHHNIPLTGSMSLFRSTPRSKRRRYLQSRPTCALLFLSLPVALIFLWAPLMREEAVFFVDHALQNLTASTMDMPIATTLPTIVYQQINTDDAELLRYAAFVVEGGSSRKPLSISEWAYLLADGSDEVSNSIAEDIATILKESPFDAFRFETKGCNTNNMETKQFEFVLVDDPYLASFAQYADVDAFSEHFSADSPSSDATVFPNLGHDAILIVPQPLSDLDVEAIYGHCANFVRHAPLSQIVGTLRMVAKAYLDRVDERGDQTVWFSTAGTGMRWLHFRLDDRPKYYKYRPFAQEA